MVRETVQRKTVSMYTRQSKGFRIWHRRKHPSPLDTSSSSVIGFCINNTFLQDQGRINILFIQNRSPTNALTVPNALMIANRTLSWKVWGEKLKQSHISSSFMLELWNWTTNLTPYFWNRITLMLNLFSMFLCSVRCLSLSSFQWSFCDKQNKGRHSFRTASPCNL